MSDLQGESTRRWAREAWGGNGAGGERGVWALVTDKQTIDEDTDNVRGRYTCVEIQWLANGLWQIREPMRTFINCYESSTHSNASIHVSLQNIVRLYRVPTVEESSSSLSSSAIESSSSSSGGIDARMYVFDKALGKVTNPVLVI